MISYKNHIAEFFKFYANFDYSKVMSTQKGVASYGQITTLTKKMFSMKGVNICGPISKKKNCGILNEKQRDLFVDICKKTFAILNGNKSWTA